MSSFLLVSDLHSSFLTSHDAIKFMVLAIVYMLSTPQATSKPRFTFQLPTKHLHH